MRYMSVFDLRQELFHDRLEPIRREMEQITSTPRTDTVRWWGMNAELRQRHLELLTRESNIMREGVFESIGGILCRFGGDLIDICITPGNVYCFTQAQNSEGEGESMVTIYENFQEFVENTRLFNLFEYIRNISL